MNRKFGNGRSAKFGDSQREWGHGSRVGGGQREWGHGPRVGGGQREWGRGSRFGDGAREWGHGARGRDFQTNEEFLREVIRRRPKLPFNDPRRRGCRHCGGDNHVVSNCPCDVTVYRGRPIPLNAMCFNCHRRGHVALNCWQRHPNSFQAGKRCWNCGGIGHYANYCQRRHYVGTIRN